MKRILLAACILLLVLPSQAGQRPVVELRTGLLAGVHDQGVDRFLGIPYALPPMGERRWTQPQPAEPWDGEHDASGFGPACPQGQDRFSGLPSPPQSEDCLFLNVWAPAEEGPHAVMVWLHGGAHRIGSGSMPFFDGARLAQRGVVLVTVNFRLGYLGFFDHPALEEGGGNFGLMDQILALRWVRDNIAAFGGDPERVTVFGESAGGADVLYLMTGSGAEKLFHRAIVQSGGGWAEPLSAQDMRESVAANLREVAADVKDARALRDLPADVLIRAQSINRQMGFGPFVDGHTVREAPHVVFADGRQQAVPLIIGSNSWEANLMQFFDLDWRGRLLTRVLTRVPPVSRWYPERADSAQRRGELLFDDIIFGAPARWLAAQHARKAPAWLYYFDYVRSARRGEVPGAGHATEIVFAFDTLDATEALAATASDEDRNLARAMADCWAAFAIEGAPDCALAEWPAYDADGEQVLIIDRRPQALRHPYAEELDRVQRRFGPD